MALALLVAQQLYVRSRQKEQGKVEDELRASQAKFSGILAIAADAIITVDHGQRIVHFNSGAEEIFGYKASDAIGRHLAILLPPRFRDVHDSHLESFARSPVTARRMGERREIFGRRSDGTEFPAEASISKLVTLDGLLFTVVLRDTTVERRAEEDDRFLSGAAGELANTLAMDATERAIVDLPIPRLADAALLDLVVPGGPAAGAFRRLASTRQRAELATALDALASHHLTQDSPSPIVDVIRRGRTELVETIDDEWLESSADTDAVPHWRTIGATSLLMLPLNVGETRGALTLIRTGEGARFDQQLRAVAERFAATAATALQNAQLYDAVRQANRARDDVLAVVSHDLRNPISAIAMCARVLEENPPGDERARRELLATIRESTHLVNHLIQDLLDVSIIERGKLSLEVQSEEPSQLALQALHMFEVEAQEQGIALEAQLPTNVPLVSVDRTRVVQVLTNLLRNALKFTQRDGRVVVALEPQDGHVLFSVADTGTGISLEKQARVFDRYWQGAAGGRGAGAGLGLSIAKGIVEAHGGTIWVKSAPGEGSVFSFTVPQAVARGSRREEP